MAKPAAEAINSILKSITAIGLQYKLTGWQYDACRHGYTLLPFNSGHRQAAFPTLKAVHVKMPGCKAITVQG